jgi:hypothetical protein
MDFYFPQLPLPKVHLSTTRKPKPRRKKRARAKSQKKCYTGRRSWTDEEKRAVQEGIRIFGVGYWSAMKNRFEEELADRTSGQIKDCYRTLQKHGNFLEY